MKHKLPYILIITLLLIAGGVGFKVWQNSQTKNSDTGSSFGSGDPSTGSRSAFGGAEGVEAGKSKVYTHPTFGFSITLPKDLGVGTFQETEGESVMVSGKSGGKSFAMQIYVRPFNEDVEISAKRIKKDIPGINMQNPVTVELGGIKGTAFLDHERGTREVWVAFDHNLYQILSDPKNDAAVGQILKTWNWN